MLINFAQTLYDMVLRLTCLCFKHERLAHNVIKQCVFVLVGHENLIIGSPKLVQIWT